MSTPSVEVYSCVTGNYDNVLSSILASKAIHEENVSFTLYTDQVKESATHTCSGTGCTWTLLPLKWQHRFCKRRTARWHKLHSHVLSSADYSVWIDGSQQLKQIGVYRDLINKLDPNKLLFTFKHPQRNCIYQELMACQKLSKDNPRLMREQIKAYRAEGYPPYNGLVETACVVRKNCKEVAEFNRYWWLQLDTYSYRDQLSFNYVAHKLDFDYGHVDGCRFRSPYFNCQRHSR
jgi:hypothetical protein